MKEFNLKTLTPVHIGSGRLLQFNSEVLIDGERCAVIDDRKVLEVLGENNIQLWMNAIEKNENLVEVLKRFRKNLSIEDVAQRSMDIYANKITGKLKEQLFSGNGLPMIPGSSIKGSIRTVIFNNQIRSQFQDEISSSNLFNYKGRLSDKFLQNKIFGETPNLDVFRYLKIGDVHFNYDTLVVNLVLMNTKSNDLIVLDETKALLTECIGAECEAVVNMKIDEILIQQNIRRNQIKTDISFMNFETLFDLANKHTLRFIENEIETWENYINDYPVDEYLEQLIEIKSECLKANKLSCVIRLGHGSGWIGMTGGWALDQELINSESWNSIVDMARPNNRKYAEYRFPKTRRMDSETGILGFVKIEEK